MNLETHAKIGIWVGIAAVAGYKPAERTRDEIASKLSEEEIKQAKMCFSKKI